MQRLLTFVAFALAIAFGAGTISSSFGRAAERRDAVRIMVAVAAAGATPPSAAMETAGPSCDCS